MKRKIIEIDESKCNGCGKCLPNCPEGALQVIDGKARLVSDLFCDGLGACVGECPEGAMQVVEREAEAYDERRVMRNIIPMGTNTIRAHLEHLRSHGECALYEQAVETLKEHNVEIPEEDAKPAEHMHKCGCPGGMAKTIERAANEGAADSGVEAGSELRQWPTQLGLANPDAGYFNNADLLICADCVPFAYGDFHRKLLKGKIVVNFCPKLDEGIDAYIAKLTHIFKTKQVNSVTVVQMEVPCCGGTEQIVREALAAAGKDGKIEVKTISIDGQEIKQ